MMIARYVSQVAHVLKKMSIESYNPIGFTYKKCRSEITIQSVEQFEKLIEQ